MPISHRARLAAFKDMHASQGGSGSPTIVLTDAEAAALVDECQASDLEHFDAAAAGALLVSELGAPPSVENEDALQEWATRKGEASRVLWDALSGTSVDGVILTRKRS